MKINSQSFSKTSLADENESTNKRSPVDRIPSANSLAVSTPAPRKPTYIERMTSPITDWKYEPKCTPSVLPSPMCSPIIDFPRFHDFHHSHYDHFDMYPYDPFPLESIYEQKPLPCHTTCVPSPCKPEFPPKYDLQRQHRADSPRKIDVKSPKDNRLKAFDETSSQGRRSIHRAKSCPKDLFSTMSISTENEHRRNEDEAEINYLLPFYQEDAGTQLPYKFVSPPAKPTPKPRINKTPTKMDKFLSSRLFRSNVAANLRQVNAQKKINDMAEEKLKATMHVSKFIPKCHHWNVRDTPAWKTFTTEE